MSEFVLSATLELQDNFTARVKTAQSGFKAFFDSLKDVGPAVDSAASQMAKAGSAAEQLGLKADKTQKGLKGIQGVYSATIRAKDEATAAVRKAQESLKGFVGKSYTAVLNVKQNLAGGMGGGFKNKMSGMASGAMMGLPVQAAGMAGVGFGVVNAVKTYADFESQISAIRATSGMAANEMGAVEQKALEIGSSTAFSATEAAQGMNELLKAGVSVKDVMGDASEAAVNLATAGEISLADSAEIMSSAMNAFHMTDATKAADLLVGAANASATSVGELKYSLSACAAVAAGTGMSLEDTSTALAVMAQNGIKGQDAGTSLKTMLMNLIPQTDKQAKLMKSLGFMTEDGANAFFDAKGKLKSLSDIAGLLQGRLKGMTKEQQQATLAMLFGTDAIRAGNVLLTEGAEGVQKMQQEMKHFSAQKMAQEMRDNLAGALDSLGDSWTTLTVTILKNGLADGIKGFVKETETLVDTLNTLAKDGLQIGDILNVVGKAFVDLKDKALAADGVGSVLAGGALVLGLGKIISMTMKAVDWLKRLASTPIPGGGSGGPGGGGLGGGKGIGDMIVNAKTVIVNGNTTPGGTPGAPGAPGPGGPTKPGQPKVPPSKWARFGKWMGRLGLPLTIASGLLDVAYAPNDQKGTAAGGAVGSTAGWLVGAKAGAALGGAIGSVVPGIGTTAGVGVGGFVGGVGGALLGGNIGQKVGGLDWGNEVTYVKQKFADIGTHWDALQQEQQKQQEQQEQQEQQAVADATWDRLVQNTMMRFEQLKTGASDAFTGVQNFAAGCWDDITATIAAKNQQWATDFAKAKNSAGQSLDVLGQWAQGTWDSIRTGADSMSSSIGSAFDSAANSAKSAWDGITGWFEKNVWGPLSQCAANAWASIKNSRPGFSAPSLSDIGKTIYDYATHKLDGNATGAMSFGGGWTEINERGGEIVDLPSGSRIYPHATTVNMLRKQFSGVRNSAPPQVNITGNTFTVREEADIDRIAYQIMRLIQQSNLNYGGAY